MKHEKPVTGPDVAAWARDHRACFEIAPLLERVKGSRVQVGFTVSLYAQLPLEAAPGAERRTDAGRVLEGLREIVEILVETGSGKGRVEIESPRTAAFFRPENDMQPEIALTARVYHAEGYLTEVTSEERDAFGGAITRLGQMGLKRGHW